MVGDGWRVELCGNHMGDIHRPDGSCAGRGGMPQYHIRPGIGEGCSGGRVISVTGSGGHGGQGSGGSCG